MNADEVVARRFEELSARNVGKSVEQLSPEDAAVYLIVATRCEMDMEGFESVFEQLLTPVGLESLIASLELIEEANLAQAFREAARLLANGGFILGEGNSLRSTSQAVTKGLSQVEERVRAHDRLWDLDEKLATLIATSAGPMGAA